MAKITFTIPSVLNQGGGEKKTEIDADSLQESFTKISEIMGDDFRGAFWKVMVHHVL